MEERCCWLREKGRGAARHLFHAVKGLSEAETEGSPEKLREGQAGAERYLLCTQLWVTCCAPLSILNLLLI